MVLGYVWVPYVRVSVGAWLIVDITRSTGKLASIYGVVIHVFAPYVSPNLLRSGTPCSLLLLIRLTHFQLFLVRSGSWLWCYQWLAIKACWVMIQNVRKIHRNTVYPLLPLWSQIVRATVLYFRPCFSVIVVGLPLLYCLSFLSRSCCWSWGCTMQCKSSRVAATFQRRHVLMTSPKLLPSLLLLMLIMKL